MTVLFCHFMLTFIKKCDNLMLRHNRILFTMQDNTLLVEMCLFSAFTLY